jgi:hypothetical protein
MKSSIGGRRGGDLHVRLGRDRTDAVRAFAERLQSSQNTALQLLVDAGLASQKEVGAQQAALAALMASELVLKVLLEIVPGGGRNVPLLEPKAIESAQARLATVERAFRELEP